MTREEATDELFDLIVSGESSRRNVALRIAIEALKAESCEDCISREETLEHIEACWINGRQLHHPELSEVKEWVKALPSVKPIAENATTTEDCISRQAAKLKVARVTWDYGDSHYDFHDKCVDCLDDLPPVIPARKNGKWIYHDIGVTDMYFDYYRCSECNRIIKVWKDAKMTNFPYCHCGAEMEVKDADSN